MDRQDGLTQAEPYWSALQGPQAGGPTSFLRTTAPCVALRPPPSSDVSNFEFLRRAQEAVWRECETHGEAAGHRLAAELATTVEEWRYKDWPWRLRFAKLQIQAEPHVFRMLPKLMRMTSRRAQRNAIRSIGRWIDITQHPEAEGVPEEFYLYEAFCLNAFERLEAQCERAIRRIAARVEQDAPELLGARTAHSHASTFDPGSATELEDRLLNMLAAHFVVNRCEWRAAVRVSTRLSLHRPASAVRRVQPRPRTTGRRRVRAAAQPQAGPSSEDGPPPPGEPPSPPRPEPRHWIEELLVAATGRGLDSIGGRECAS